MVVEWTITSAISTYHYLRCEFEFRSCRGVLDATLCDKVCQWLVTGRWISPDIPLSIANHTDRHELTEILLKVMLNTIAITLLYFFIGCNYWSRTFHRSSPSILRGVRVTWSVVFFVVYCRLLFVLLSFLPLALSFCLSFDCLFYTFGIFNLFYVNRNEHYCKSNIVSNILLLCKKKKKKST